MSEILSDMQDPLGLRRLGYGAPLFEHLVVRIGADGHTEERVEAIAEEVPVALNYNRQPHVVMMATPSDLEDFAVGFSLTEELIASPEEVLGVEVSRYSRGIEITLQVPVTNEAVVATKERRLQGRTGCGICGADSVASVLKTIHHVRRGAPVAAAAIHQALGELHDRQVLNARAGAVHAAGWATPAGAITLVREDVGRHNALDKLVGAMARGGHLGEEGFVVVTSRASFEMVQKAAVLGAPLLAAISGPTALAIRVAQQSDLTLVGFARGERLSVYTHPWRVQPAVTAPS
jgi:FdhD protein